VAVVESVSVIVESVSVGTSSVSFTTSRTPSVDRDAVAPTGSSVTVGVVVVPDVVFDDGVVVERSVVDVSADEGNSVVVTAASGVSFSTSPASSATVEDVGVVSFGDVFGRVVVVDSLGVGVSVVVVASVVVGVSVVVVASVVVGVSAAVVVCVVGVSSDGDSSVVGSVVSPSSVVGSSVADSAVVVSLDVTVGSVAVSTADVSTVVVEASGVSEPPGPAPSTVSFVESFTAWEPRTAEGVVARTATGATATARRQATATNTGIGARSTRMTYLLPAGPAVVHANPTER
jgi:hypothetical protein